MNLGERIKAARKHAKLTQAELGKAVGVSQQMIQKIEGGGADGTAALLDICIVTGVSPRWLARDEGGMFQSQSAGMDIPKLSEALVSLERALRVLGLEYNAAYVADALMVAYEERLKHPEKLDKTAYALYDRLVCEQLDRRRGEYAGRGIEGTEDARAGRLGKASTAGAKARHR